MVPLQSKSETTLFDKHFIFSFLNFCVLYTFYMLQIHTFRRIAKCTEHKISGILVVCESVPLIGVRNLKS